MVARISLSAYGDNAQIGPDASTAVGERGREHVKSNVSFIVTKETRFCFTKDSLSFTGLTKRPFG